MIHLEMVTEFLVYLFSVHHCFIIARISEAPRTRAVFRPGTCGTGPHVDPCIPDVRGGRQLPLLTRSHTLYYYNL